MAYTYIQCKSCGAVQRSKLDQDSWSAGQVGAADESCGNAHCSGVEFTFVQGKQDIARLMVTALAQKIVQYKKYVVPGPVRYNVLRDQGDPGPGLFREQTFPDRDIKAALERLANGHPLPQDVNGRQHFHDGGKYQGQHLPIRGVKQTTTYYSEWGMLSSSRGWEKNLGSERLVTGASGEIYYSSLHYHVDWWWVFSSALGKWTKFKCRW